VAFSILGRNIAWYGILITCGMMLALYIASRCAKVEGVSVDDVTDLGFFVILFGVLGARAYYVIFTWNQYDYLVTEGSFFGNLIATLYNCIAMWDGGLAIYGGILAGLLTAYIVTRVKKIPYLKITDILVPCVLIGQVIGRWGNFINIEAFGGETDLPWRMGILFSYTGEIQAVWDHEIYVHPTFLYESLWNLIALIAVAFLYKKKKFNGQLFFGYLIWYGFGRMLIEGLRTDSLMLGAFRVSQLVGLASVLLGVTLMALFTLREKKEQNRKQDYTPMLNPEAGTAEENKMEE
jgi:phosphatidylglycerol:prolipoprotein diacylglycerol transferase